MSENRLSFEEILAKDGYLIYTNKGCSMYPLLRQERDILCIEKKPQGSRLKKHDIVLFRRNGKYILHRIVKVKPDGYDTAGDHNWWKEKDVSDEDIIGILTSFVRDGKTITVNDPKYKLYTVLWCSICKPLNAGAVRTRHIVRKVIRHE